MGNAKKKEVGGLHGGEHGGVQGSGHEYSKGKDDGAHVHLNTQTSNVDKLMDQIIDIPLRKFINGNFHFLSDLDSEVQGEVISRMWSHFSNVTDNLNSYKIDPCSLSKSHHLSQWVIQVTDKSSEYSSGKGSWGVANLIGGPVTFPKYGDISSSWAPRQSTSVSEFLELKYEIPVHICGIDIFETWNPGCVVKLSAHDGEMWRVIWTGQFNQPSLPEASRVFSPAFPVPTFKSNWIRIDLDTVLTRGWTEIDCVRLRGREEYFWSPSIHHRFPVSFRRTVKTLLLVVERLSNTGEAYISQDVCFTIIKQLALSYD
eukprot:TRINITY_DN12695_c0_g1_i1.p1 TRINITY_DN12695_c0_g1~~TRINITY_DN12695_c0_g1_i1.p1  ORF type:complete len:315 (+),score=55.77 TRINITY_DN12695_c0_g1_i1:1-945(+)